MRPTSLTVMYAQFGLVAVQVAAVPPGEMAWNVRGALNDKLLGLTKQLEDSLQWDHILMEPGDALIFSSYLPHRSQKNLSPHPRRALFLTSEYFAVHITKLLCNLSSHANVHVCDLKLCSMM